MRAVFLDYETVSNGDLDTSGLSGVMPGIQILGSTSDSEIAEHIADAEIVVHGAKHLKLIALAATGTDNVDLAAARERTVGVDRVLAMSAPASTCCRRNRRWTATRSSIRTYRIFC